MTPDVADWRRRRSVARHHRLRWLVGRLAIELAIAVALGLAGVVSAAHGSWWVLVAVAPLGLMARALWRGWWLGAAVVTELRWRALLASLIRRNHRRR